MNDRGCEDPTAVPEWASALTEAIPVPAAVMSPDGRVLYANGCLRLAARNEESHGAMEVLACERGDRLTDRFPGLRRLLDGAARTGSACGEVAFGSTSDEPSPATIQVRACVLAATWDRCSLILVTLGQGHTPDAIQRKFGDYEDRYKQLMQASTDLVFLMDLDGTLASVNRSWQQRTGYEVQEALGKPGVDFVDREFRRACQVALDHAKAGQYVKDLEFRAARKNGDGYIDVVVNLAPVRDEQGQVVQVIGAGRDITDFKRTQEELKNSEERLKILFEYAPDAYFLHDLKGTFLDGNKAAEELCGYKREELIGKDINKLDLLPTSQLPRAAGILAKSALGKPTGPNEFSLTCKDGTQIEIETRTYPVQIGGRTVVLGIARDISKRKKAEAMLEALNRDLKSTIGDLEWSNQELRDFAHVAAHDLKAPLRGIATLADWISQDCADKLDERGRENFNLLQQRVDRMTQLISGILRYAEIGHGGRSVEDIDANEIVAEVIEQIAAPRHIEIRVEGRLPVVSCERIPLMQVFMNLISNAVKYMDKPKGEIRVSAVDDGDSWKFTVVDNGMGIEERYFDRIFQMFQTLAPSHDGQSTGIGLAVVKKIVQMHGGTVGVKSEPGRGSTFFFTLPKEKERSTHENH
ncbi:MAG: PAS domain S-box protein [Solirubrobacterales bacterium]